MKIYRSFRIIIVVAMLLALVPAGTVLATPEPKVDVCHRTGNGSSHLINISANALPAHLAHGDALAGDPVPGAPGKKFSADCTVTDVRTLVDTVTVPSNGNLVPSNISLVAGVTYELVANGTYRFANWGEAGIADARCSFRIPGSYNDALVNAWIDGEVFPGSLKYYLQLWVNGSHMEWGTGCDMTHTYTTSTFVGSGAPLNFKIVDDYYGDNSGFLTVKIYRYN